MASMLAPARGGRADGGAVSSAAAVVLDVRVARRRVVGETAAADAEAAPTALPTEGAPAMILGMGTAKSLSTLSCRRLGDGIGASIGEAELASALPAVDAEGVAAAAAAALLGAKSVRGDASE
jgi:hypothetical protein